MTETIFDFERKTGPRLNRQEKQIVELFKRQGRKATNIDMGELMQRFGGRLFTLRKKGYDFRIVARGKNSVNTYEMTVTP